MPGKLSEQLAIFRSHPQLGAVCGAASYWRSWAGGEDRIVLSGPVQDIPLYPPAACLAVDPLGAAVAPCNDLLVRRDVVLRVGGFENEFTGMYEDQAFLAKIYLATPVCFSSQVSLKYRQHPESCMALAERDGYHKAARRHFYEWFAAYVRALPDPKPLGVESAIQRELIAYEHPLLYFFVKLAQKGSERCGPQDWIREVTPNKECSMMTITAIIPVRNRERLVVRALESVFSQTYPPMEVIVVDDASTDGTPYVVDNLAKKFRNLILIRLTENVGAARARNVGAEVAKGDLLAFLNSDDTWYPKKLEKQINEFQANKDIVAIFCGCLVTTNTSSHRTIPPTDISLMALYHRNPCSCSTLLMPKEAFAQVGGFDVSLPSCQDWDLFIRLAEIGKIRVVQEELSENYEHTEHRISNDKPGVLLGHHIVFNKIYERLSDPSLFRVVRASHECILAEIFCADIFEPRRAFRHAAKALAMAPSHHNCGYSHGRLGPLLKVNCRVGKGSVW